MHVQLYTHIHQSIPHRPFLGLLIPLGRYRCIYPGASSSLELLLSKLEEGGKLKAGQWAKGKTRVFMKVREGRASS